MRSVTRILLLGSAALFAQDQVVRITVNLLQVDAVVVKADDFEILQDGKKQKISSLQFVQAETATRHSIQPLPQGPPKPGDVLRTIAIVVDDIGLAFEDIGQIHASLKTFVDERIQPGHLRLGTDLEPGDYVLEIQMTDKLGKAKQNIGMQYIDFEITPAAPVIPSSR